MPHDARMVDDDPIPPCRQCAAWGAMSPYRSNLTVSAPCQSYCPIPCSQYCKQRDAFSDNTPTYHISPIMPPHWTCYPAAVDNEPHCWQCNTTEDILLCRRHHGLMSSSCHVDSTMLAVRRLLCHWGLTAMPPQWMTTPPTMLTASHPYGKHSALMSIPNSLLTAMLAVCCLCRQHWGAT